MKQVLAVPAQLGPLLKGARRAAALSQNQLAGRLGISQSRMSHMELNPGSISLAQLLAIFAALDLEVMVGPRSATGGSGAQTPGTAARRATARTDVQDPETLEW
jgi:HTH-type transcriptional regulator/antitoxin HipB